MDPLLMEEIAKMLREELRMLHVEIREAFPKSVFPSPFIPVPKVQAAADDESFNESEQLAAESEQHTVVYTGDMEPIFNAEFAVFDQELNDNPHLTCVDRRGDHECARQP
jgi:hypothetical protein